MLVLDAKFVQQWRDKYNEIFEGSYDQNEENAIRDWLSKQGKPKYLNKEYFVRLGRWKTKRQTSNYEANHESDVIEATRSAYQASDELVKLNILKKLKGVGVAVAATILHYLQSNTFPIFDYHARTTLKRAGFWNRSEDDASNQAWLEYTNIMRGLSARLNVSLRDLDKALFAYDKYGDRETYGVREKVTDVSRVSKGGKTLYIELSIYPCGQTDPTRNLTISCPDRSTRFKTTLSDYGLRKFRDSVLRFYKELIPEEKTGRAR